MIWKVPTIGNILCESFLILKPTNLYSPENRLITLNHQISNKILVHIVLSYRYPRFNEIFEYLQFYFLIEVFKVTWRSDISKCTFNFSNHCTEGSFCNTLSSTKLYRKVFELHPLPNLEIQEILYFHLEDGE